MSMAEGPIRVLVSIVLAAALAAPAGAQTAAGAGGGRPLDPPAGALVAPGPAPAFTMIASGDVIGYIEDCGCKHNPAGGLSRRAWLMQQLHKNYPAAGMVAFDSGNFADNPNEEGDVRTRALLEGMARLGYKASNIAERDLALGYDDFKKKTDGIGFPFVSTNIVKQGTRDNVFSPYTIVDVKAGGKTIKVGVLGVVRFNPVWQKAGPAGANLAIAPPAEMVKKYAPEVKAKSDLVVLLAALSRDDAGTIAKEVPEIDFVIGAYGGVYSAFEETDGRARVIYTGNQGKRIGETRVFLDEKGKIASTTSYLYFLTARYPDDPETKTWVENVNKRVAGLKKPQSLEALPAGSPAVKPH